MSLEKYRLKLNRNKDFNNDGNPQYSLKYQGRSENPSHVSFSILSALVGNNDVVVMLNSDLFQNMWNGDSSPVDKFINDIRQLGLFHVRRNTPTVQKLSFLGFQSQIKKKIEIQEAAVYVPNQVWKESFSDILPVCGAAYFVTKTPMSVASFMNGIFDMADEEKAKIFSFFVFDLAPAGQMGISSKVYDQQDITALLGL